MVTSFIAATAELQEAFGTENVAPLLGALVRLVRPRCLLEVGAGLTTLHILQALKDNLVDDGRERANTRTTYGKTDYYNIPYRPCLITLDDLSHKKSLAPKIQQLAAELQLDQLLEMENSDFRGFSRRIPAAMVPLDFVWFDCGGLHEYVDFTNEYWPLINPAGGMILFHSTLTNLELRLFITRIAERHARPGNEFELINLLEPHKKLQNSISMVRMTSGMRTPIYTYEP